MKKRKGEISIFSHGFTKRDEELHPEKRELWFLFYLRKDLNDISSEFGVLYIPSDGTIVTFDLKNKRMSLYKKTDPKRKNLFKEASKLYKKIHPNKKFRHLDTLILKNVEIDGARRFKGKYQEIAQLVGLSCLKPEIMDYKITDYQFILTLREISRYNSRYGE